MSFKSGQKHAQSCLKRVFQTLAFYSAYCVFGGLGLASSIICFILSVFFEGTKANYFGQKIIHRLFAFFVWYVGFFKVIEVKGSELEKLRECQGTIFVANHPSLLDVVYVIAHMPRMFCVMKASLTGNPVLSGQARLAGYVDGTSNTNLIKSCRDSLRAGGNLLIFPEGTRSTQGKLGPFKMGFALVAKASAAPVQTLIIEVSENYLGKGYSFIHQPTLHIQCTIRLGECFVMDESEDPRIFGRRVESYYQNILQPNPTQEVAYYG